MSLVEINLHKVLDYNKSLLIFALPISNAQVAELVDALVSNTNAFGRAGSTPALGTKKLLQQ